MTRKNEIIPRVLTCLIGCTAAMAPVVAGPSAGHANSLLIWEDSPSGNWDGAYPVGNGRLGAMPWGLYPEERILINEETIWENKGLQKIGEDAGKHLEVVRDLVAEHDYSAADRYFENHLPGGKPSSYQLAGWLKVHYPAERKLAGMRRSLDLATGIATTRHALADGNSITQRVYASAPEDVIVVEIRAEKPISFRVTMEGPALKADDTPKPAAAQSGELRLNNQAEGSEGPRYVALARSHDAGACKASNGALEFHETTSATILLSVATDVNRRRPAAGPLPDGWQNEADRDLQRASSLPVEELRRKAVADHKQYFDRVAIDLGATAGNILALPTGERILRVNQGAHDDPDLMECYFQFGRYLLIASSRPGTFPANLQGLWNAHMRPPWQSDYHLDINLQMNYWLAETCNLGELQQPVFDLIRSYETQGREMAERCGMKGWAMGICTDLWGNAGALAARARWSGNFLCGQWLAFQILDHYRFNRDPEFLEGQWDILTAATEFAESWLVPGPDGRLVSRLGSSPENEFTYTDGSGETKVAALSAGNTFDQYVMLEVFGNYLEAAAALGKSSDPYVLKIASILPKVYRPRIAEDDGRLMEWSQDFGENEPGHRHISHLVGAYPGNQIDLDGDTKMREAVLRSMEFRLKNGGGGIGVGWSRAWCVPLFARMSKAAEAYDSLHFLLAQSTLPNLWNNKRPFQIEGNFGATAGIAEMLLQSHRDGIRLLPALPAARWPDGGFSGLRARGDHTVDVVWKDGKLKQATVHAGKHAGPSVKVAYRGKSVTLELAPGRSAELNEGSFN